MKLAFVDTETMGLDIDLHAVFEVGLILRDGDEDKEYSWLLPVETLAFSDPFALKLNGFHDRHPQGIANIDAKDGRAGKLADAKITSLDAFANQFIKLTRDAHWIGMVPSFDEERVRRIVRSQGLTHAWHYHLQDCEVKAAGYLKGQLNASAKRTIDPFVLKLPYDSEDISRACGIDPASYERHTALGDCRWSRDLWDTVS